MSATIQYIHVVITKLDFCPYKPLQFLAAGWWNDYSFECEECDYSDTPRNRRMINVAWVFWISKGH